jgi:hypothetical protein
VPFSKYSKDNEMRDEMDRTSSTHERHANSNFGRKMRLDEIARDI